MSARLLLPSLAAILAATQLVLAAPREDESERQPPKEVPLLERMVPIPGYSPPVGDNGCRLRNSPTQAQEGGRSIPFWELISDHVARHSLAITLAKDDPRAAFANELAPLDSETRTLASLFALWNGFGRDGLHTFFFLRGGTVAHEVRNGLEQAGLTREHGIFKEAMALFGSQYPVDEKVREQYFGYAKPGGHLNAFDRKLLALAKTFPSREALATSIETFVARQPALWQRIEARRQRLGAQRRLGILNGLLWAEAPRDVPDAQAAQTFAKFKPEERVLMALDVFNAEFENGGVHQFFFNSSGAYAPEVNEALLAAGLTRQAAIFKRGMDMFLAPYARDRQQRASSYIGRKDHQGFESGLSDLTDDFYAIDGGPDVSHLGGSTQITGGPGIRDGMQRFAVQHRLLPC